MQIDHGSAMQILPESQTSSSDGNRPASYNSVKQIQVLPYRKPSKSMSATPTSVKHSNLVESSSEDRLSSASPPKRDIIPAILTDTIKTGSDFR